MLLNIHKKLYDKVFRLRLHTSPENYVYTLICLREINKVRKQKVADHSDRAV
jgi:hypothetical protein